MSRVFRDKNKDLINLDVVTSDKVWVINKAGKMVLNSKLDIYGRVEKGFDCFVTTTNKKGTNHKLKENTCNLSKKTQNGIIDNFINKNKRVVYLVKKKES